MKCMCVVPYERANIHIIIIDKNMFRVNNEYCNHFNKVVSHR